MALSKLEGRWPGLCWRRAQVALAVALPGAPRCHAPEAGPQGQPPLSLQQSCSLWLSVSACALVLMSACRHGGVPERDWVEPHTQALCLVPAQAVCGAHSQGWRFSTDRSSTKVPCPPVLTGAWVCSAHRNPAERAEGRRGLGDVCRVPPVGPPSLCLVSPAPEPWSGCRARSSLSLWPPLFLDHRLLATLSLPSSLGLMARRIMTQHPDEAQLMLQ